MNYNIIATGSKGNCIIFDNKFMFDCGVPYNKINDVIADVKIIFITHQHNDHLLSSTINKIAYEYPNIKFVVGQYLVEKLVKAGVNKKNIFVLELDKKYSLGLVNIKINTMFHDVPNVCFHLEYKDKKIFYGTDTGEIDHIKALNYDLYFIEANYESDEELDKEILKHIENGLYTHKKRVKYTHLSMVQALNWLHINNKNNGEYVFIHQHIKKEEGE